MERKFTTIVVDQKTRDDLRLLGQVPESYNDVIRRLLEEKQPMIEAIRTAKAVTKQK